MRVIYFVIYLVFSQSMLDVQPGDKSKHAPQKEGCAEEGQEGGGCGEAPSMDD